jgi:MFS family permease
MMIALSLGSFVTGPFYERLGARLIVSTGAACLVIGMLLLARIETNTTYIQLVPGMIVLGLGIGLFYSTITTAAITAVDAARSSLAGAILYMLQIAGGAIGIGLNTTLVVTASSLARGIQIAFLFDAALAACGFIVCLLFIRGRVKDG